MSTVETQNKTSDIIGQFIEIMTDQDRSHSKMSPLLFACVNKLEDVAIKIIDNPIIESDPRQTYKKHDSTALVLACSYGLETLAMKIIDMYGIDCRPGHFDMSGVTPLIYICCNNAGKLRQVAIKLIDTFGILCNPGCVDIDGDTALIRACRNKLNDVAIKLIDSFKNGCNPGQINNNGDTALLWACVNHLDDVVVKLIKMVDNKCRPYHIGSTGSTPLLLSCNNRTEQPLAIKLIKILGIRCNPGLVDNDGDTALLLACKQNLNDVAIALIKTFKNGCNPGQVNNEGDTALLIACKQNLNDVALALIKMFKNGCNPGHVNNSTALMFACSNRWLDTVALELTNTDCNPGYFNSQGWTALSLACYYKLENVALSLINTFGTDCNIHKKNNYNKTVLEIAQSNRFNRVVTKIFELAKNDILQKEFETIYNNSVYQMKKLYHVETDNECISNMIKVLLSKASYANEVIDTLFDQKHIDQITNQMIEKQKMITVGFTCVVCYDLITKPIIFDPCNHIGVCKSCSEKVKSCPICRTKITKIKDVYIV